MVVVVDQKELQAMSEEDKVADRKEVLIGMAEDLVMMSEDEVEELPAKHHKFTITKSPATVT